MFCKVITEKRNTIKLKNQKFIIINGTLITILTNKRDESKTFVET